VAGVEGGDGGVDERLLVAGVGEVELRLGDQGTPGSRSFRRWS
jgi:hypothetical protein